MIGVRGAFEVDRGDFFNNGGANWTFAAQLKWNLFDGFRKRRSIAQASHELSSAQAVEKQMTQAIRLQVRKRVGRSAVRAGKNWRRRSGREHGPGKPAHHAQPL